MNNEQIKKDENVLSEEQHYQNVRNSILLVNPIFVFKPEVTVNVLDKKTQEYEVKVNFQCISCGNICDCDIQNKIYTCKTCFYDMKFGEACYLLDKTAEILYESRRLIEETFSVQNVRKKRQSWMKRTLQWFRRLLSRN